MSEELDFANFKLDAVKALSQIRLDYIEAVADYNLKAAQTYKKLIEAEQDKEKLLQYRDTYRKFDKAIKKQQRRISKLEKKLIKENRLFSNAERLYAGEYLQSSLVSQAWLGFFKTIEWLPGEDKRAVVSLKIYKKHRDGKNFSRNRYPNKECDDCPSEHVTAFGLFAWCRSKAYSPRQSSDAMEALFKVFELIEENASARLDQMAEKLETVRKELLELRQTNWRDASLLDSPKEEEEE